MTTFEDFCAQLDEDICAKLRLEKIFTMETLTCVPRQDLRELGLRLGDLALIDRWKVEDDKEQRLAHHSSGDRLVATSGTTSPTGVSSELFTIGETSGNDTPPIPPPEQKPVFSHASFSNLSPSSKPFQPNGAKNVGHLPNSGSYPASVARLVPPNVDFNCLSFLPVVPPPLPPFQAASLPPPSFVMVQDMQTSTFQPFHSYLLNVPKMILLDSKQYHNLQLIPRYLRNQYHNAMTVVTVCQISPASDATHVVAMIQDVFNISVSIVHETEPCFSVTGVDVASREKLVEAYPSGLWTNVERDGERRWCVKLDDTLSKMTPAQFLGILHNVGIHVSSNCVQKRHRIIRITVPIEDANVLCNRSRTLLQDRDGCFFVATDGEAQATLQKYVKTLGEPSRRDALRDALLPCNPVVFELLHRFSRK